tara:strand:- start:17 stop:844 length:828 start_codon:yes stop_codon:yes gene_type:complete
MIEKIDQESEEYRKWKEGSVTVDIDDKTAEVSTEKTVDASINETGTTSEEEKNPNLPEETIDDSTELPTNQSLFDRTFKVKNDTDRMKKTYYFITALVYYCFCCFFAYDALAFEDENRSLPYVLILGLAFAVLLPFVLIIMGFTVSGGAFIGIFIGLFSWFFGLIARFIYKLLGFDMEIIFPELVGKTGEVSKHSLIGKFAPYPFTAEMENMGVYGDSLFYKNRFSIRSDEELEIGMQIEVIKHEKRTITSLVKNHPTFLVKVLNKENKEETTND